MRSVRLIKQGEEIFNDYGSLPRAEFLRRYGSTPPDYSKYDELEVPRECLINQVRSLSSLSESALRHQVRLFHSLSCGFCTY